MAMNTHEILARFDQAMRREAAAPSGYQIETSPTIVRHVGTEEPESFILYSALTSENADAEIAAQVDYFRTLGHTVEWKTYSHDNPSDLVARLERAGFVPEDEETLMVFDLRNRKLPDVPSGVRVRRLTNPAEIDHVTRVQNAVWGTDHLPWLAEWLRTEMIERPDSLSVFVVAPEGQEAAASVGWITYADGKPFAGLWGGSTAPEHRGQGLYRALVAARLAQARTRTGVRYVSVDALPSSRPILEKLGFIRLTETRPCILPAPTLPITPNPAEPA